MEPSYFKEKSTSDKTRSALIIVGIGILLGAAVFGLTSLLAADSSVASRWVTAALAFVSTILAMTAFTQVTTRGQQIRVVVLSIVVIVLGVLALTV